MEAQLLLCGAAVLLAAVLAAAGRRHFGAALWGCLLAVAATVAAYAIQALSPGPPAMPPEVFADLTASSDPVYAGSDTCRPCHPSEHQSWSRTYHRTMTQVVSPETVAGDFGGLTLMLDGRSYRLRRDGDTFLVDLADPDQVDRAMEIARSGDLRAAQEFAAGIPVVTRPILASTGSHHYQLYWYPSGRGSELYLLPFAYLLDERRWVPRVSTFLNPPYQVEPRKVWNRDCLPCHATAGRPGYEPGGQGEPETAVAEPGIACEACHGPGREHAEANRDPLRRYLLRWSGDADHTIVEPLRLAGRREAEVCGQCHSLNTQYEGQAWAESLRDGHAYTPGEDLSQELYVVQPDTLERSPLLARFVQDRPGLLDEWFWSDGTIRVAGREYNGLIESPCFSDEDFTCMACHSMHESDPDDQLRAGMDSDAACLQCHAELGNRAVEHTRHEPDSPGSRCMNCHMPHTTYGLLKASRSHTVSSPSLAEELSTGRPNACNLCHLDRSLAWTRDWLTDWYGMDGPALDSVRSDAPAGAMWLLAGDAGMRAIAAWNAGWDPARAASEGDWLPSALAPLLSDPYDAVRYVAGRSLRKLPGFERFEYDYIADRSDLEAASERVALRSRDGLDPALVESLLRQRDDRPVYLVE